MKRVPSFQIYEGRHKSQLMAHYPFLSASQIHGKLKKQWQSLDGISQMSYSKMVSDKGDSTSTDDPFTSSDFTNKPLKHALKTTPATRTRNAFLNVDSFLYNDKSLRAPRRNNIGGEKRCKKKQRFNENSRDIFDAKTKHEKVKFLPIGNEKSSFEFENESFAEGKDIADSTSTYTDDQDENVKTTYTQRVKRKTRKSTIGRVSTTSSATTKDKFTWDDDELSDCSEREQNCPSPLSQRSVNIEKEEVNTEQQQSNSDCESEEHSSQDETVKCLDKTVTFESDLEDQSDCYSLGTMFQDVPLPTDPAENPFVGKRRLISSAPRQGVTNFESMFEDRDIFSQDNAVRSDNIHDIWA